MNDLWFLLLRARAETTLPLGIALAVLVTLHVLLHKRQVASAVGWIGLAWFAPITGALAYAMFGVNRVRRRAQQLRPPHRRRAAGSGWPSPIEDDHIEALERGVGQLTGRPAVGGNQVDVFHNGDEAYPAMLAAIAAASQSVGLTSYIFRDDKAGGAFIEALAAAHARGVAVRVIIDGIGGEWLFSPAYHRLRRHGVPAVRFLHSILPWRMPFLNLRSHRKILVVDGSIGFTGGINIGDENVATGAAPSKVQDTHFRFIGPVAAQLTEAFAQDWNFSTGEDLTGPAWFPDILSHGQCLARVVDSGPDEDIEKLEFAMLQAVTCARESVTVMTAYFLPDERLITALALAAQRGVGVDVIFPAESNQLLVDSAARANSVPLLEAGVRLWRCPPPFRHSKLMVVDAQWSLIGSCNWDIRSFRLNFELCVEVYQQALAEKLETLMQAWRLAPLTLKELHDRTLQARLRDTAARLMLPYL